MNVREKAYRILLDICIHKKYSHLVLKDSMQGMSIQDKNLVSHIVYGTMRNYEYLDYQWKDYCEKMAKNEIELLINMSVYQLLFLDRIPDYAVVNDAVDIAKQKYNGVFEGFVNAILRKVIKNGRQEVMGTPEEILAIECSLPLWLVKMWNKQYGQEISEKLCKDTLLIPKQTLRVNTIKISRDALLSSSDCYSINEQSEVAVFYHGSNIAGQDDFMQGLVSVQDAASQAIAPFLNPQKTDRVLDMCSAPGSKTAHMAALMENQGHIEALELHEHRCEILKATLRRLGCIHVDVTCCDASTASKQGKTYTKILLDAPCSGYGVLKRKSDIKYHMQSDDMDSIIEIQTKLLREAIKMLDQDGELVYSTCTLNKKENEFQINKLLEEHDQLVVVEQKTIFPYEHDSDGFYMAKLRFKKIEQTQEIE